MGQTRWTEDEHVKLLVAVLATCDTKPNPAKVSRYLETMGIERTPKALMHKLDSLRKLAADGASPGGSGMKSTSAKRKLFVAGSKPGMDKSTGFEGSDDEHDDADGFHLDTPTKKVKTGTEKAAVARVKIKKEKQKDKLSGTEVKNEGRSSTTGSVVGDADADEDEDEYGSVNEMA